MADTVIFCVHTVYRTILTNVHTIGLTSLPVVVA